MGNGFVYFAIAFLLIVAVLGMAFESGQFTPVYTDVVEDIEISMLSDSSEVKGRYSGNLFAQSGRIDEKMYYRVMLSDGAKKRYYKLSANDTDIYEYEDGENVPHIEVTWIVKEFAGKVRGGFANTSLNGFSDVVGTIEKISLYVPKGTIDSSFEIDLND